MADNKQQGGGGAPEQPEDDFGDFLSDSPEPQAPQGSDFGALTGGGGLDDDAGLGNLPPLSDFESESAASGRGESGGFDSGLPPLDQIHPEVPQPTGGNVRPAPPGFEDRSAFDTPISDSGLDTPHTPSGLDTPQTPAGINTPAGRTGFQDLTADSDFSPETPEIGPGPDSDLETPMFDSAFGAGGAFDRTPDTSAPTQAMETPIFGQQGGSGFDPDAFTGSSGAGMMGGGTPIPDFSPDTGIPGIVPPPPSGIEVSGTGAGAQPSGGMSVGALLAAALIALLIGAGVGSWFSTSIPFVPASEEIAAKDKEVTALNQRVTQLQEDIKQRDRIAQNTKEGEEAGVTEERRRELATQIEQLTQQSNELDTGVKEKQANLEAVLAELEAKTTQYAETEKDYQDLMNQVSIERARSEGLDAQVQRLEDQVGSLEEAAQRSSQLKERLISDINRLEVLVQDGIALTPAKYAHENRLEDVRALKEQVANAQVVTPDLLDQFTRLMNREMEIAQAREYFFAKIPVQDRYGTTREKWAEAVMNGNWSVYFRTLDGSSVGIYERVPGSNPPEYAFRQFLAPPVAKQIEQEVIAARVPGYEEKISQLAQREVMMEENSGMQRVFDSL